MDILPCGQSEVAGTGAFYDRVVEWLDRHINYPHWTYRVYPSEESVREMTESGSQYIGVQDGEIVAAFALSSGPGRCYRKIRWSRELEDGSYMVLHALAVDPRLQGQGVGSEIVRFCVDQAKQHGCRAIRLEIVPGNLPAERLFKKNGFVFAGEADLELGRADIPVFRLYELNW